jgi:Protein of unknown function (DUF4199)
MKKITPLIKGTITATGMLALTLVLFYAKQPAGSGYQYFIYVIYAAGILWALIDYARSVDHAPKFTELFGQGFRCFIMVTLIMVTFTAIFTKMHPEFAEESSVYYKQDLVKDKNRTPAEIDKEVTEYKKQFTTRLVSLSIFGYLLTGVVFTAAGAGLLLIRRR